MANYPERVLINDSTTQTLLRTIKTSYKQIVGEINGASNFGVANRKAILAQIDVILTGLGEDVNAFVKDEIPKYYKSGANDATTQLQDMGADIPIATGFNRVHLQAIAALVSDTAKSFGDAIQGVSRSAHNLLSKQVKAEITQQLATGVAQGSALKTVSKQIKGILSQEGLDSLKDKRGASWSLDRYSEMLIRTKAVEARNTGFINRMVQNGYDLQEVSTHAGSCPLCSPWQGKILSVMGDNPDYPSLSEAEDAGLFHPNCRHAINAISDLSTQTEAYNIDTGQYSAP